MISNVIFFFLGAAAMLGFSIYQHVKFTKLQKETSEEIAALRARS